LRFEEETNLVVKEKADIVFLNGKVITVDANNSIMEQKLLI